MKKLRLTPVWLMVAGDLLLTAAVMLTFAYFHHVRMLWGIGQEPVLPLASFGSSEETESEESASPTHTHSWSVLSIVAPGCVQEGYTLYGCACGQEKKDDLLPPAGHRELSVVGAVEPTDESVGYTGDVVCGVCGEIVSRGQEIPAKEHERVRLIGQRAPTCTEEGYSGDWFCDDCGKIVAKGSVLPTVAHEFETVKTIPATCQTEGYTLRRCRLCGMEKQEDFQNALEHVLGDDGKCKLCGEVLIDRSGDFGGTVGQWLLPRGGNAVSLKDDAAIRAYAKKNALPLTQSEGTTFRMLYRSHDIYLVVREVSYGNEKRAFRYFDYDIYVRNLKNLSTEIPKTYSAQMDDLVQQAQKRTGGKVIAAVNGDYFGNYKLCKIAVRNGQLLRHDDENFKNDVAVLFYDGTMKIYDKTNYDWEEIASRRPYQIWQFGPGLLDAGGAPRTSFDTEVYDGSILSSAHPRTALGYHEPGHYRFVCADGRNSALKVPGMNLSQLADLMASLGCTAAYNLDGGDSSQAYLDGELIRGSAKRGDDQRNLCDILLVSEIS